MTTLIENYQQVLQRIAAAEKTYGRTGVQLLAVSKTKPIEDIAVIAAQGQRAFGENYVQEAVEKIAIRPDLEWHFIGPIQSNKTKLIAENFAWVHSVDRLKIATRLNQQRPVELGKLKILLEVNISGEPSKAGFQPETLLQVLPEIMTLEHLEIRGLMAIPEVATDFEAQRRPFHKMRTLLNDCQRHFPSLQFDTLSMGMSGDLEAAIAEGSTCVRIGTDIFGARDYHG